MLPISPVQPASAAGDGEALELIYMVVVGTHVAFLCLLWFSGKSPLNC